MLAAFEHEGATQVLVHHLKYRGISYMAELAAEKLAPRVARLPLVPVPRALSRRLKYGVDPAHTIAVALSRRVGAPVLRSLRAPVHTRRRAGNDHSRPVAPFRLSDRLRFPVIVVDDVLTTGSTVMAAVDAIGTESVRMVVSASMVSHPSNLGAQDD